MLLQLIVLQVYPKLSERLSKKKLIDISDRSSPPVKDKSGDCHPPTLERSIYQTHTFMSSIIVTKISCKSIYFYIITLFCIEHENSNKN